MVNLGMPTNIPTTSIYHCALILVPLALLRSTKQPSNTSFPNAPRAATVHQPHRGSRAGSTGSRCRSPMGAYVGVICGRRRLSRLTGSRSRRRSSKPAAGAKAVSSSFASSTLIISSAFAWPCIYATPLQMNVRPKLYVKT